MTQSLFGACGNQRGSAPVVTSPSIERQVFVPIRPARLAPGLAYCPPQASSPVPTPLPLAHGTPHVLRLNPRAHRLPAVRTAETSGPENVPVSLLYPAVRRTWPSGTYIKLTEYETAPGSGLIGVFYSVG